MTAWQCLQHMSQSEVCIPHQNNQPSCVLHADTQSQKVSVLQSSNLLSLTYACSRRQDTRRNQVQRILSAWPRAAAATRWQPRLPSHKNEGNDWPSRTAHASAGQALNTRCSAMLRPGARRPRGYEGAHSRELIVQRAWVLGAV